MTKKVPKDKLKKRGRKSKYYTHVEPDLKKITNWCRDGDLEVTICKRLGISETAFNDYKLKFPDLTAALKNGKQEIDYAVESALLKKSLGYKTKEVSKTTEPIIKIIDGQELEVGKKETIRETIKEVPGDTTAQIFWLVNRSRNWNHVSKLEITGANGGPIQVTTPEERRRRIEYLQRKLNKNK